MDIRRFSLSDFLRKKVIINERNRCGSVEEYGQSRQLSKINETLIDAKDFYV